VYSHQIAAQKASKTTTVPADVETIVAAVLRGKETA
jgi:hypothetical protein